MSNSTDSDAAPPPPPDSESPSSPAARPPSESSTPPPPSPTHEKSPPAPPTESVSPPLNASPPPPDSSLSPPTNNAPPPPEFLGDSPSPPAPPHSPYVHALSPPPPSSISSSSSSSSSLPSPPPPPPTDNGVLTHDQIHKLVLGLSFGLVFVIIALAIVCVCCCRKKRRKHDHMQYYGGDIGSEQYINSSQHPNWNNGSADHVVKLPPAGVGWHGQMSGEMNSTYSGPHHHPLPPPSPPIAIGFNQSNFTYEELAAATGGFSDSNLLGQGGFGYVHKGVLPNGKEVAVKSLKSGSGQGEREFQAEVEIISRVHHRHLVSLKGYCIAAGQRMLVYEFVPNKTLEYHLHGKGLPVMDWPSRLRIALGSAKGLAYLHEDCHPRIIHRDIKSANILLDSNFEAMVADFGLAKLSSDNYTHVSTRIMGTFGYLAPEYAASGKLTEKSDVFSFGVMLLEIITGKRPVDPTNVMEDSLVDWARPLLTRALEDGNYNELVDFRLENNYNPQEMQRLVACAAASIRHSAKKRPKMSQIARALEGDASLDDLNDGARPGNGSMFNNSNGSSDYDTGSYNADMKRFRQVALSSQEFGSSELGSSSTDSRDMSYSVAQRPNF